MALDPRLGRALQKARAKKGFKALASTEAATAAFESQQIRKDIIFSSIGRSRLAAKGREREFQFQQRRRRENIENREKRSDAEKTGMILGLITTGASYLEGRRRAKKIRELRDAQLEFYTQNLKREKDMLGIF